jgi:exodeoxyribonuclease VII large subunit
MKTNIPEYSVSQFSKSIKLIIEDAFGYIRIKGEVSNFKKSSAGHLYFNLKENDSLISAVCFKNNASLINFVVADGLEICASGKITTFEGRSNYQIIVDKLEISGIGAILEMLEKRRQKLLNEGLFDIKYKKKIPFFPKIIGLITSETGAVIEDIKVRISSRCPSHILVYPSAVQGEKSVNEIIAGLNYFNKLKNNRPDVLIIARGGGSFEDLLPFNDEQLIRTVFKSEIPVVSAIGHETDNTLLDLVADLRAPTPTASVELITPVLSDLKNNLLSLQERMVFLSKNIIAQGNANLINIQKYILDPKKILFHIEEKFLFNINKTLYLLESILKDKYQKIKNTKIDVNSFNEKIKFLEQKNGYLFENINSKIFNEINQKKISFDNISKALKSLHYKETINRGYAIIKSNSNQPLTSASEIKNNHKILIEMFDGELPAEILDLKFDRYV